MQTTNPRPLIPAVPMSRGEWAIMSNPMLTNARRRHLLARIKARASKERRA